MWAAFIEKAGLKKTTIITMVLAGISMIAYGNAVNIAMYAVALVCIVTFINAFACNCGFAICANWFPTKKGIVMGITTIGMNSVSALINWILTGLANSFQICALSILGIAIIVLAVLLGLLVKGTPEEAGCYPDNDPETAAIIKAEEEGVKEMEKVSYAGALKNKYVWIFGLGAGCFWSCNCRYHVSVSWLFHGCKRLRINRRSVHADDRSCYRYDRFMGMGYC